MSPTISNIWRKLRGSTSNRKTASTKDDDADPIASDNEDAPRSLPVKLRQTRNSAPSSPPLKMSKTAHHKFSDILPMPTVTKSPYEAKHSAEAGEPIFERLKRLLLSREELKGEVHDLDGSPTLTLQDETIDLFGEVLANSFIKANHVIGKSGILFSPLWVEDKQCKIRGVQCGWISKPMMLLLLQEQRFGRADDINLTSVVSLLGVVGIFFDALREWKLEHPRLESSPTLQFTSKKRECLKCLIFVARVYRCIKVLRLSEDNSDDWFQKHEPNLFQKVQQCLDLMSKHVKVNQKRFNEIVSAQESKRQQRENRKRSLQEAITAENNRRQLESQKKRKTAFPSRAREPVESPSATGSSSNTPIVSELPEVALKPKPLMAIAVDEISRKKPGPEQPMAVEPVEHKSTEQLLQTVKKEYRRLGRSIKKLEKRFQEERELLREELRKELLQEGPQQALPTTRKNALRRRKTGN